VKEESMKDLLKNKLKLILVFIMFYLIVEMATFIWVDFNFLPKDFLIDIVIAFAIGSVTFLFKSKKLSIYFLSFFAFIFVVLFLLNVTMYSVYLDLFTIQQLQLIGEATEVIEFEHISILSVFIALAMGILYFFTMRTTYRRLIKTDFTISGYYKKAVPAFLASVLFVFGFFMIDTTSINNYLSATNVSIIKRASLEKYGMLGYYTKEIEGLLEQRSQNVENPDNTTTTNQENPYLSEPTDYFGLLEGKNVITILLESVQSFAINETLTPNMYLMAEEGLYFDNSFSENKTNHSELISIIGNYPMTPVNFESSSYDFSYGMPSVLLEQGYETNFFHDNVETFYDRGLLMPDMGFENIYLHEDLYPGEDIWSWGGNYTLDSVTMEKMLDDLSSSDQPFYSYWATLSTHGPYDVSQENIDLFEELGYFEAIDQAEVDGLWTNVLAGQDEDDVARIRYYQAAVMELDKAIGLMLDDLEEKGILDDTVIVMYGDHNVYYHEIYLKIFEGNNDYYNMDMYENFFCIYNSELTEEYLSISGDEDSTISEFVSPYSIVPTLYDLLGIEYDTRMFIGHSIFEEGQDVFYSLKLTGFFDDQFYSNDGIDIVFAKELTTEEERALFLEKCMTIRDKMEFINNVYIRSKELRD
jgi:phosphoglycerol transferase MdoB-like AlkP superfamily enzyme